jgi:predicted dehydrogenase
MAATIGVGFCGAGRIVRSNHLPNLEQRRDRYRVAGFYDVAADRAAECAGSQYTAYPTYEELLADASIDLVVVATKPLRTHSPAARQALEAGKHVLIEKPMAATSKECDELIELARRKERVLTVHHNRRLDLDFLATCDLIRRGKIGDPRLIVNSVGSGGYEGGDFEDWGVHLIDQALQLNPSALQEVSAILANPAGGTLNGGYGEATLRFARPPVVRAAMLPRPQQYLVNGTPAFGRFYALGSAGTFVQRTIEDPRDLMNSTQNFDQFRPDYVVPDYLRITRREYYDHLYESLANGAPLLVKPGEARNAIRVLELLAESALAGRTVPATGMLAC